MQKLAQCLLLIVVMLLALCSQVRAEDCTLKQVASLPIVERIPGMAAVEVTIGSTPRYLLVDTGGVYSELFSDVVDELGLNTHEIRSNIEIYDVKGNVATQFVTVPKWTLGGLHAENYKMIVEPRDNDDSKQIDGILGPDVLTRFDVEFDFAARRLNLFSPEHCKGQVVYWSSDYVDSEFQFSDGHIVLPMMLDGREIRATLDTGAENTYLNEKISQRVFDLENNSLGMERASDVTADALIQYRYRFKSLSLKGVAVSNPLVYILPNRAEQSFGRHHLDKMDFDPVYTSRFRSVELLLGMNVLSKLHLYIAYREHKIYLTAAGAH